MANDINTNKRKRANIAVERVQAEYNEEIEPIKTNRKITTVEDIPDEKQNNESAHAGINSVNGSAEMDDNDEEDMDHESGNYQEPDHEVIQDLYLDSVNRSVLDFDFEKLCSVSLSNQNVYSCLVCGKYYQGRGKSTHAYFHSINDDHHVFINLKTLKVYILPDQYEVVDSSLNDIKAIINPTYTKDQVSRLEKHLIESHDLSKKKYLPGFVGLNNLKANDYMNVVIQALSHIKPIRDKLLLLSSPEKHTQLIQRLSLLVRKMWFPHAFKGHVSPHEFVQEVVNRSDRRFRIDFQGDSFEFLTWLLNTLHVDLGGTKKRNSSIIYKALQGEVSVKTQDINLIKTRASKDEPIEIDETKETKEARVPFLTLSLELPPTPLFHDEKDNIIPQVALATLLKRYDGTTTVEWRNEAKRYQVLQLPKYVILHMKRFKNNNFTIEKNPTIVNFPIRNVALGDLIPDEELKRIKHPAKYNLLVNVSHEGKPPVYKPTAVEQNRRNDTVNSLKARNTGSHVGGTASIVPASAPLASKSKASQGQEASGTYQVHVRHRGTDQWYRIQDLLVDPIMPQMIFLSESYIQIWEREKGDVTSSR
ncbi:U4 U6.U5 tri-snRNP-associated protein [Mycoemilia scoparia]|uniref:U4 U6.U5 tri-snRNP-associated protein n=1 Tax=Mycoemilia scoparia TaxID=417184 RepID=A0A9W8DP56_9FUNG|nr:U4 U6.U5 tri-snRNP-associated protein [Mycoemilia scoparia]